MLKKLLALLKKLFDNKNFIFIFTFIVQIIFYYIFEYMYIGGEYFLPDLGISPIVGLIFGPVGSLGNALGSLVFQIYEGTDLPAALVDTGIQFFVSLLSFKLWYASFRKMPINTPKFDSLYNLLKFFSIMFIVSIVYWTFIDLTLGAYSGFRVLYPLLGRENISYLLNMFEFSIIFGLFTISLFNILKIPLQTPKRWVNLTNINYKYFITIFIILVTYSCLSIITNIIDNDILDNIFFLITGTTAIIYLVNKFDVQLKIKQTKYSIIEKVILIFLIMVSLVTLLLFEDFYYAVYLLVEGFAGGYNGLNDGYIFIIAIAYIIIITLILAIIHIHSVETTITNPIYDLKTSLEEYKHNGKLNEDSALRYRFERVLKNDDEMSKLLNSFILLKKHIQEDLSNIKKTVSENERIATEFNVASRIQSNMLKTDFEEFAKNKDFEIWGFMNPAREVGGDFYDYFEIDEDNIGFVIGDVSGKGVPATLFMVKTMYLIRNHSKFKESPNEVFENVNDLSCRRNDGELFVTSWFGKLNVKTGKLTFVNAGHNQPLIKQSLNENKGNKENNLENGNPTDPNNGNNNSDNNSNVFEYLKTRPNLVLGGMEGIPYTEHALNLKKGDIIFLYTDGITEANNNYQGFYGEDRLKETINRHKDKNLDKILENIKNDVYEFCKNKNQFDDMTMLILKYNGSDRNG